MDLWNKWVLRFERRVESGLMDGKSGQMERDDMIRPDLTGYEQ